MPGRTGRPPLHGHARDSGRSPAYRSWMTMKSRCFNKNATDYNLYGGKGVTVCERWANSFQAFLSDMGERPKGTSLDRFPNRHGDYEPGNCRWATPREQEHNKDSTRLLTFNGSTRTVKEWAKEVGVSEQALRGRLSRGWSIEEALTTTRGTR